MFSTIIDATTGLSVTSALICTAVSLAIGILLCIVCRISGYCTKSLLVTVAVLPVIVEAIIMMVNGNIGTGIAIAGAFGLVRFRSYPGTALNIAMVFAAMACGLATGTGYLTFAAMLATVCSAAFIVLSRTKICEQKSDNFDLRITIPEDLEFDGEFDDIFDKYTKKHSFERVKTTNLGSMYELHYIITMKDIKQQKAMIDEIRCRNGNLTVQCGKSKMLREEL